MPKKHLPDYNLSDLQGEFHGEVLHTLNYVVNQSDYVVQTLRNVTQCLSLAKNINVDQVFLPSNIKEDIDKLNVDLNTAANTMTEKTCEKSGKIGNVFSAVRFIWSGWLLVAVTFILCGVFVILNNTISDTCAAMEEWVDNPQAETALSNILPCVNQATTNKNLIQSKEVISQLVNVVNMAIYTVANWNPPPQATPYYYNRSGRLMLPQCSPFDYQLHDRSCGPQEVSFSNASVVWQNYTCTVSASGLCTSVGRITPEMYMQLVAALNASYALDHYAPPLLSLQDCNFVRETFRNIISDYCPPLEHYLQMVGAGLGLIPVAIMLCLVL